ncbi:MAG: hypothetical protein Q9227_007236 [Pyrenula ochraceoflavens]
MKTDTTAHDVTSQEPVEEVEDDIFPLEDLKPLCQFRSLRYLQLNGMLQSYQKYIWLTTWLNPNLEELVLEMALKPSIRVHYVNEVCEIDDKWILGNTYSTKCLGEEGNLLYDIGEGEYLDQQSMRMGRNAASAMGCILRFLPVARLTLAGFVVDAGPFYTWFSPLRLCEIKFQNGCFDAGFGLPPDMLSKVAISRPASARMYSPAQRAKLFSTKETVKLINLERAFPSDTCCQDITKLDALLQSPFSAQRLGGQAERKQPAPATRYRAGRPYLMSGALSSPEKEVVHQSFSLNEMSTAQLSSTDSKEKDEWAKGHLKQTSKHTLLRNIRTVKSQDPLHKCLKERT